MSNLGIKFLDLNAKKKALDYFVKISLAALILALPTQSKWVSYSLILLTIAGVIQCIITKTWTRPSMILFFLMGAYLVRVLWLYGSEDLFYGLKTLETEAPLFCVPLVFSLILSNAELRRFGIHVYILMNTLLIMYVFVKYVDFVLTSPYPIKQLVLDYLNPLWFWGHARYFAWKFLTWENAHYSFFSIMAIYGLILFFFLEKKSKTEFVLFVVYAIWSFSFILITGSRVGMLLIIANGILVGLISVYKVITRRFFWGFITVIMLVFVGLLVKYGPLDYQRIDSTRYHYAELAVDAWRQRLWVGHGTGDEKLIMNDPEFEAVIGYSVNHPHNQYLSELLKFGVIGSIPLFLFLILGFYKGLLMSDKTFLSIILTIMIFMIVECPINSNKGVMPMMVVISLVLGTKPKRPLVLTD